MTESYGIEIIGDKKIKKGAEDLLQNNDKYTVSTSVHVHVEIGIEKYTVEE